MKKPITFNLPWLIACEGPGDKKVLDRIVQANHLDGSFEVRFPGKEDGAAGSGRGGIVPWLDLSYETVPTFRENVKAILIISDNDDNPETSFAEIKKGLQKTKKLKVGIPAVERVVAKAQDFPALVVMMIPHATHGNLETLCLQSAYQKWGLQNALDTFVAATPANGWGVAMQSKMRIQTMLAATCHAQPDTNLANVWQQHEQYHIPVAHPCFDDVVTFLQGFGALLAA